MGIVDIELGELSELAAALGHYADVVLRLVPSVSPVPASCATPLMAGEALGLTELLAGLASYGWPTSPPLRRGPADQLPDLGRAAIRGGPGARPSRAPEAPPLPDDLEALLRRMRLPHMRRLGRRVLATARAQRWEPAEVLRVPLKEEIAGRERSSVASRRTAAAFLRARLSRPGAPPCLDHTAAHPGGPAHAGVGRPPREPGRLRPVGHRQVDVPRSPRPGRR